MNTTGPLQLPALPWDEAALEPVISSRTIGLHYGKHHRAYVDKVKALVGDSAETLEAVILRTARDATRQVLFNNAAQAWNHAFYWQCLRPKSEPPPAAYAKWAAALKEAALGHFGSGWAWLSTKPDGTLSIHSTANQDSPLSDGLVPVIGLDVWEHAYYLHYQNRRADYVAAFWAVLNWEQAAANFAAATKE